MRLPPDKKLAGVLAPVFAIRTETDLGIGDTEGVRQMMDWCHQHGLGILQVLPINETSDDNSPYNAISSLAIEPATLTVTPSALPDLPAAEFQKLAPPKSVASLRSGAVNYPKVKALKWALLRAAFDAFVVKHWKKSSVRGEQFRLFIHANAEWIADYAMFRLLMRLHGERPTWDRWPAEHQNPKQAWSWLLAQPDKRRQELETSLLFFMYVQWIAFRQWEEIKDYGTRQQVYLMGDIPFGVSRYSADVWANRGIFDLDWSGGAPPEKVFKVDPFTEKWGQNWGIPLYDWAALRHRNYDWWRTRVGNVHKVFHLFRIDHVLGFFRIYSFPWTPDQNEKFLPLTEEEVARITGGRLPGFKPFPDDTPEHCAANRQQGEELLTMVKEAAGDTAVVAEDLGCVPPYVPVVLEALQIPGFKIPHFLREKDGSFVDGRTYPRLSLATPATHDHDPLAKMWRDLWARVDAGGPDGAEAQKELQRWLRYGSAVFMAPPRPFTDQVHETILRGVLQSNSWLAVLMITDVFAREDRFNVPGSIGASNWSARLHETVAGLDRDPVLVRQAQTLGWLIQETGRHP